jgi:tRNA threonylcarbamoyl adenosine modification protein YeaZ
MPNILVIDTATAACSVALLENDIVVAESHDVVGRGHAERLMPLIAALPGGGRADAILVDCGPGSFTGVRVGVAAARALGLGWGVPVRGFSSTMLMAAVAAEASSETTVGIAMLGGHGELFVQRFAIKPFAPLSALQSLPPEAAARFIPEQAVHGSGAAALIAARGWGTAHDALPFAAQLNVLPAEYRHLPPQPIYGRDADATPVAA